MDNGFLNVKSGTVSSDDAINNILGIKSYAVFSNNNIDINGGEILLQGETAALLSKPIIDANDDVEIITGDNKRCSVGISEYEEFNQDYYTNKYVKIKINKLIEDSEENEYVYRMIDAGEDIENNEQMYTDENMDGNEGMYTDESIDIDTHINVEEKGQNLNISDDSKIFIVIFGILICLAGFLFFKCI